MKQLTLFPLYNQGPYAVWDPRRTIKPEAPPLPPPVKEEVPYPLDFCLWLQREEIFDMFVRELNQ